MNVTPTTSHIIQIFLVITMFFMYIYYYTYFKKANSFHFQKRYTIKIYDSPKLPRKNQETTRELHLAGCMRLRYMYT